jgi:hypothetical protein
MLDVFVPEVGLQRPGVSAGRARTMAKSHLKLVTPATVKRTVSPKRRRNGDLRTREYLTEAEVEKLMNAAKDNRWGPPGRNFSRGPSALPLDTAVRERKSRMRRRRYSERNEVAGAFGP